MNHEWASPLRHTKYPANPASSPGCEYPAVPVRSQITSECLFGKSSPKWQPEQNREGEARGLELGLLHGGRDTRDRLKELEVQIDESKKEKKEVRQIFEKAERTGRESSMIWNKEDLTKRKWVRLCGRFH